MAELPRPTPGCGIKLASIAAHARELLEPGGHELDAEAIRGLLADPEVAAYMDTLGALALLPEARRG